MVYHRSKIVDLILDLPLCYTTGFQEETPGIQQHKEEWISPISHNLQK